MVPNTIPIMPRMPRSKFLATFSFPPMPLNSSQNTKVCIIEGAIKANVDEATAPIREIKRSIFGMAAAKPTKNIKYD